MTRTKPQRTLAAVAVLTLLLSGCALIKPYVPDTPDKSIRTLDAVIEATSAGTLELLKEGKISTADGVKILAGLQSADRLLDRAVELRAEGNPTLATELLGLAEAAIGEARRLLVQAEGG